MDKRFAPPPGRLGVMPVRLDTGNNGNLTANQTNTYFIPVPPGKYYLNAGSVVTNQVPVDADGTILATFFARKGATDVATALNTASDLETLVTQETRNISFIPTLTDAQRILDTSLGDALYVNVVSNSAAIDTQPTNLGFAVEAFLLR